MITLRSLFLSALVLCIPLDTLVAQGSPVTGAVFLDANANGTRDPGEAGIPRVVVSNQLQSVQTSASGEFRLDGQGYGLIFVSVPDGYGAVGAFWKAPGSAPLQFPLARIQTAPAFTFIHASDTHLDSVSFPRMRRLQALVDSIRPDFVLITGDLIRDALRVSADVATARYEMFVAERGRISRPV